MGGLLRTCRDQPLFILFLIGGGGRWRWGEREAGEKGEGKERVDESGAKGERGGWEDRVVEVVVFFSLCMLRR